MDSGFARFRLELERLGLEAAAHRVAHRLRYGFTPYAVAIHPRTWAALTEGRGNPATALEAPDNILHGAGLPPSVMGLPIFQDPAVPENEAQLLSEAETLRRYAPRNPPTP